MWHLTNTLAKVGKGILQKKMLKKDVRSRNVYENKGNKDKVPDEKSDIYVNMTRILQKRPQILRIVRRDHEADSSCWVT